MNTGERGKEPAADTLVGSRQLRRLERMMDVVFALAIWRLVTILPRVDSEDPERDTVWEMLTGNWADFAAPLIAIVILVVYWLQNNAHFSRLRTTDTVHTALAVSQLFLVMVLIYGVALGVGGSSAYDTRVFESAVGLLLGVLAYASWRYAAAGRRLVLGKLSDEEIGAMSKRNLAEPLTALATIPFAVVGPIAWELSWFLYPLWLRLLRKRVRW